MTQKRHKAKSATRQKIFSRRDIALLALDMAGRAPEGWAAVTPAALARKGGFSENAFRRHFSDVCAIWPELVSYVDDAVCQAIPPDSYGAQDGLKDRLFDLLMERYSTLNRHRPGFAALLRHLRQNPQKSRALACALESAMTAALDMAEAPLTAAPLQKLASLALLAVYLATLREWEKDESPDLAATMHALDKRLDLYMRGYAFLRR